MNADIFRSEMSDLSEEDFIAKSRADWEEKNYFLQLNLGAELHWFFTQAADAHRQELYISACTSFLIGIEASLRITLALLDTPEYPILSPEKTLSNRLIVSAKEKGLPVQLLAFEDEDNFEEKLATHGKQKIDVDLVKLRHNLCHGNFLDYHQEVPGLGVQIFTPECMRLCSKQLYLLSKRWMSALSDFRQSHLLKKAP